MRLALGYQQGTITLQNLSNTPIYVGGTAIAPGSQSSVPLQDALNSTGLYTLMFLGAVAVVGTPGYEWGATRAGFPWSSAWYPATQLPSNPYTLPTTPLLSFANNARIWVNVPGSAVTLTLNTSPDQGTTWYPLTEWGTDGTWTISGTQQTTLPAGIPLLQGILTYSASTAPTVSITLTGN